MEFRLKGEVPAEKRNIFIFIGLRCDKDSLPSDEKLKKKTNQKKNQRICFVLSIVVRGHSAVPGSHFMSSLL